MHLAKDLLELSTDNFEVLNNDTDVNLELVQYW